MQAINAASRAPGAGPAATTPTIDHPLPDALGACVLIHGFLSPAECQALIVQAEAHGFASAELDYPPSYRNNDRWVLDDPALAASLQQRLADLFADGPHRLLPASAQSEWQLQGINERLRLCRYRAGQQFRIHQDGVHHRGPHCRSMLTFMVYLTDGDAFEGGDTLFYAAGPSHGESERQVVARVRPGLGSLVLFDHGIWHAGETLARGTKYVLRSDLLFRRSTDVAETSANTSAHQGYIWTLASLSDGTLASGGRDGSIRLWSRDGALSGTLAGHGQSVLGLSEISEGGMVSISRDRTMRWWELASGRCFRSIIAHEAAVLSIARLSRRRLATGGADHAIQLWSEHGVHLGRLLGHQGWIWGLVAMGDEILASVSEDQSVRLWNPGDGECVATRHVAHPLRSIDAYQADPASAGKILAAGDESGRITLWTLDQGTLSETASFMAHSASVRRVRFLRSGYLATCGEDNVLRIWNSNSLRLIHEQTHANFVTDVIELSDGTRVSCGYDGELVWSPMETLTPPL